MGLIHYKEIKGYKVRGLRDSLKENIDNLVFGINSIFYKEKKGLEINWNYFFEKPETDLHKSYIGLNGNLADFIVFSMLLGLSRGFKLIKGN